MAFDYNSRTKWEKERVEKWNKAHEKEIRKLSPAAKELFEEIGSFSNYPHCGFPVINKWGRANVRGSGKTLREIMHAECGDLIAILVPEEYQADYDYMLDQFADFQYSRALFRPTVRTKDPMAHVLDAFGLMQAFKVLGIYGISPAEYLRAGGASGTVDPELADFINQDSFARALHMVQFDDIVAAKIDQGDAGVIEAVREAILSDNNTVLVSVPLIRGIVKSRNAQLHDLLAKFLVAARLQEGVRQAVCENADCGRAEAFLTILKAIEDNDLIRFSAVKRAIATWTGICNLDSMDRVSDKLLAGISKAVRDQEAALVMTQTDDSVQIVTGLWALGFYEAQDAIKRMLEIVESGTKNQRLTISYYNRYMQFSEYSDKAAQKILETYPEDLQMAAAFMPTYMDAVDVIARNCIRDEKNKVVYSVNEENLKYIPLDVHELFDTEEKARLHYGILKNLADSMKKKKVEYVPLVFPWYGAALEKSDLTQRMAVIAYALQDQALIDDVCIRLSDITDSYYNTRKNYVRILLHDPRTQVQKDALIAYAADKEGFTRTAAWQILKKVPISEEGYLQLEKHLRLKNEDTRHNVIDLLERQDKASVDESIKRLLGAGQEQIRLAGLDMLKRRSEQSPDAKRSSAALLREILPDDTTLTDKEKVLYEEIAGSEGAGSILNAEGYGLYDPKADYKPDLDGILDGKTGADAGGAAGAGKAGSAATAGSAASKAGKGLLGKVFGILSGGSGARTPDSILKGFFTLSAKEMDQYFDKIKAFILEHGKLEYTSANGEKQLLENGLFVTSYNYGTPIEEHYPFPELWEEVYDTIIRDPVVFFNLAYAIRSGYTETSVKDVEAYRKAERTIFGDAYSGYFYNDPKFMGSYGRHSVYETVLDIIASIKHLVLPMEVAQAAVLKALELPENIRWMEKAPSKYINYGSNNKVCFMRTNKFRSLLTRACHYENSSEFCSVFPLLYQVDKVYEFEKNSPSSSYSGSNSNILSMFSYVKAYEEGVISRDFLYKAAFDMVGIKFAVGELGDLFRPVLVISTLLKLKEFLPVDMDKHTIDRESRFYKLCAELYRNLTGLILDVELKRGDTPTIFSNAVFRIPRVEGIPRLMEILRALGKDPLDRSTYYSYVGGTSKRECLSHLLKVSYPIQEGSLLAAAAANFTETQAADSAGTKGAGKAADSKGTVKAETAEDLKKAVKAGKISDDRLIEVAMYAPQWMQLIEEVLGIDGFTSGCYYFMAHMNERFDDRKKAVIARYTPLSPEELNNGCFDTNWFFEVYEKLGEKTFAKLYKAAKYIADGSKHTRARKYADAAVGKVDRDELEKTIEDKRNKDLLMSYGLIPMKDRQDALHRYEFLQKFLKESKQFGAQRRQSEAQSVQYALKNMATTAGYADDLRLTLAMETELVTSNQQYFDGTQIGDYVVKITVDPDGKAELVLAKKGKTVKSVPAALKKDETFNEVKDFAAKLKNQYSRCVAMFERAMEEEDPYSYGELRDLCVNPVTAGILNRLVFIGKGAAEQYDTAAEQEKAADGQILLGTLEELRGAGTEPAADTQLLVAHPITLYRAGRLPEYQRMFFEKQKESGIRQPFKQVFREFYVKLEEEKDAKDSRMFAGYQIQPKKTVAALRGRRWVADYDEGLQKVFFKQNISATIYALADWFSPADTECPTLEYVSFYDRKTYRQKNLSEIPDILYSEVMRDVDLAVSVAHVGGVDPETSHSTIEMRRVIFEFNMELFGLTNVTFEGTHAYIKGTLGNYNVQLGSGVIHKESGGMVNIVPVHSQQRGKIFLPFIDEDPKTAEILAKILLLAEDNKIKDPYILQQLR